MKFPSFPEGILRVAPAPRQVPHGGDVHLPANESIQLPAAPAEPDTKPYLARLVLLVPAEVISLFITLKPMAKNYMEVLSVSCLVFVILIRAKATRVNGVTEWPAVIASAISFCLWLYTVDGYLPFLPKVPDPNLITILFGICTFAIPYFYHGGLSPPKVKDD